MNEQVGDIRSLIFFTYTVKVKRELFFYTIRNVFLLISEHESFIDFILLAYIINYYVLCQQFFFFLLLN